MFVLRYSILLLLACWLVRPVCASVDLQYALNAIRLGENPELIQALVEEHDREPGPESSSWDLLDLWLKLRQEPGAGFELAWRRFHDNWPQSTYLGFADYLRAQNFLLVEDAEAGSRQLLDLLNANDARLARRATSLLEQVLEQRLEREEIQALVDSYPTGDTRRQYLQHWLSTHRLHCCMAAILPLKGADAALGHRYLAGMETALAMRDSTQAEWSLEVFDCESDPLRALQQARSINAQNSFDCVLLPGRPEYAAAVAGVLRMPVLFPWFAGDNLLEADANFYQLNTRPRTQAAAMADLAVDSLKVKRLISLAPATRSGKQQVDSLNARLQLLDPELELGPPQWYFPGAQDMRRQLENIAIYEAAFDTLDAVVVYARPEDVAVLVPQLAYADLQSTVLSDASLISARDVKELATLSDQLLILSDWLPNPRKANWARFLEEFRRREMRSPELDEQLAYESARLVISVGELARRSGSTFGACLNSTDLPSAYGGRLLMQGRSNGHLLLLRWDGWAFRAIGGMELQGVER